MYGKVALALLLVLGGFRPAGGVQGQTTTCYWMCLCDVHCVIDLVTDASGKRCSTAGAKKRVSGAVQSNPVRVQPAGALWRFSEVAWASVGLSSVRCGGVRGRGRVERMNSTVGCCTSPHPHRHSQALTGTHRQPVLPRSPACFGPRARLCAQSRGVMATFSFGAHTPSPQTLYSPRNTRTDARAHRPGTPASAPAPAAPKPTFSPFPSSFPSTWVLPSPGLTMPSTRL